MVFFAFSDATKCWSCSPQHTVRGSVNFSSTRRIYSATESYTVISEARMAYTFTGTGMFTILLRTRHIHLGTFANTSSVEWGEQLFDWSHLKRRGLRFSKAYNKPQTAKETTIQWSLRHQRSRMVGKIYSSRERRQLYAMLTVNQNPMLQYVVVQSLLSTHPLVREDCRTSVATL